VEPSVVRVCLVFLFAWMLWEKTSAILFWSGEEKVCMIAIGKVSQSVVALNRNWWMVRGDVDALPDAHFVL
jgi:hypothetical protein